MKILSSLVKKHTQMLILAGILILLIVMMSFLSPSKFLTASNFSSMGSQMAEFGVLAIAMSVVVLTGGINLSLTFSATLSAILGTFVMSAMAGAGSGAFVTIVVGLAVMLVAGLLFGFINGYFIAFAGIVPILVTLATRSIFEGIGLNLTKGMAVSGLPEQFQFFGNADLFGIPVPVLIYLLTIIVSTVLVQQTPWGVSVYMLGGNVKATEFSGINTKKSIMLVYIMSGVLAALAAIVMTSRYNSARTDYGSSYLLQSVAATVLGGFNINGGVGRIFGTVLAVAIMQVLSSGLNIFGVNRNLVDIVTGAILLLVLAINFVAMDKEKNASHRFNRIRSANK